MCAKQQMPLDGVDKKRVLQGPGRVIGVKVQGIEVEPFVLELGSLANFPPHRHKDIGHLFH